MNIIDTRKRSDICSRVTTHTPFAIFVFVNFEHVSIVHFERFIVIAVFYDQTSPERPGLLWRPVCIY